MKTSPRRERWRGPRSVGASTVLVLVAIIVIGALLALQGWKSNVPDHDSFLQIEGAYDFVERGQIPEKGVLASFSSYNPPGIVWLTLPGFLVFQDLRLFDSIGSLLVYSTTIVGVFLLARMFFGNLCGLLAAALYGFSAMGLTVGRELWQRYPNHACYVWMIYFAARWVWTRRGSFLAAAVGVWAVGMYTFMEMAPALFVLPVLWFFYRPPIRMKPLLLTGGLAIVLWFPYLRFEHGRSFSDIKSLVGREDRSGSGGEVPWCAPNLRFRPVGSSSGLPVIDESVVPAVKQAGAWERTFESLRTFWGRRTLAIVTLWSNCGEIPGIPGLRIALALVFVFSLLILALDKLRPVQVARLGRLLPPLSLWVGLAAIAAAVIFNEMIVRRYLSARGSLDPSTVIDIRFFEAVLFVFGTVLLVGRSLIVAGVLRLATTWAALDDAEGERKPEVDARLLVIGFLIPWGILVLVSEPGNVIRFWWLWPLQVIIFAAGAAYVPRLFRMGPWATFLASAMLAVVLIGNSLTIGKIETWRNQGWAGTDPDEVKVVDFLVTLLSGRKRVAIGYEIDTYRFLGVLNGIDEHYRAGTALDLVLKYRHRVMNTNVCPEGASAVDEFRIIQTRRAGPVQKEEGFFEVAPLENPRVMGEVGPYRVVKRMEVDGGSR